MDVNTKTKRICLQKGVAKRMEKFYISVSFKHHQHPQPQPTPTNCSEHLIPTKPPNETLFSSFHTYNFRHQR